jgi:uncharacterized protein (DUF697 family)
MFSAAEQRAVFAILLHAALADGTKSDAERAALKRITEGFAGDGFNPWSVYQEVLGGRLSVAAAVIYLEREPARLLAYEMALGVCETDGPPDAKERAFLDGLRAALALGGGAVKAEAAEAEKAALAEAEAVPLGGSAGAVGGVAAELVAAVDLAAVEKRILNHAILAGALELLPQSLATMAVVPLQMKLVYGVGKAHGYALDRGHIKDFLATAGAGLAAQAVEGYARKLLGGLVGGVLGKGMVGGLGRAAVGTGAGAAITFAATYAIGQLALRYYGGGRKMETAVLKDAYAKLLSDGRRMFGLHQGEVERRAATLTPGEVINLVRQP